MPIQSTSKLQSTVSAALAALARASTGEAGQGMVEYALILVLVSIVVIVILITQGGTMLDMFSNISTTLHSEGHM